MERFGCDITQMLQQSVGVKSAIAPTLVQAAFEAPLEGESHAPYAALLLSLQLSYNHNRSSRSPQAFVCAHVYLFILDSRVTC